MQQRTFGRAGWRVGALGIGTWQFGGDWGPVDDEANVRTLLHAFERGINFVDTALAYGWGRSHRTVGRALRAWSGGRIHVATKIIPLRWPDHRDDDPDMRGRYPAWYLREEVDRCLETLGVERLDLLQLHCWAPRALTQLDWLETLNALRIEGKIDRVGVSIRDNRPDEGVDLARLGLADSQQVVFNLFDQRPADRLFRAGEATGTAFLARVPLDSGALVGDWMPETWRSWGEGDMRLNYFKGPRFEETYARVQALKKLCAPYYPTLAEAALRFCVSDPAVAVVIPGMTTPAAVDQNLRCFDGAPFPAELREALRAHVWARNFYFD